MSVHDTQELRLLRWPRLGTFPGVPALTASCIVAWMSTGIVALGGAIIHGIWPTINIEVPDTWYTALAIYSAHALFQFTSKRVTHKPEGAGPAPAATP